MCSLGVSNKAISTLSEIGVDAFLGANADKVHPALASLSNNSSAILEVLG